MGSFFTILSAISKALGLASSIVKWFDDRALLNAVKAEASADALQKRQTASTDAKAIETAQAQKAAQDQTDAAFDPAFFRKDEPK